MKAIMIMFDSLNRRSLEPYGSREALTPNFKRLAEKTIRFDNCYAGSLPCIPARRELHTGRYNFLHRSWGPLEPFDVSAVRILGENNVHTHLVSDHGHYWECGGATYHTQYTTWEGVRGQEGDPWAPAVGGCEDEEPNFVTFREEFKKKKYLQDLANRRRIKGEEDFPLIHTFDAGVKFLEDNSSCDSWFLQIESFSPHEPFMASRAYKDLYPCKEKGKKYEWPAYAPVIESEEEIAEVKYAYFAVLSMCDAQLGRILDVMDQKNMWEDTMLIVNTDHGFMLGEHGYWAKNYMPCYDEIVHNPLFIWDPRLPDIKNTGRKSLVQTIDLPATLLRFFRCETPPNIQGRDLFPVIKEDYPVRDWGLFGIFGSHICCTDGRYVYMRGPKQSNIPLYEYTLMPTHIWDFFSDEELKTGEWHRGFEFTKGFPLMRFQTNGWVRCIDQSDLLFDLNEDPQQFLPLNEQMREENAKKILKRLMRENEAPEEMYQRYDI